MCVVVITNKYIVCANAGDSRCVVSRGKQTVELSEDLKPENYSESKRIEIAGGFVADGKISGELSFSRGLGYFNYK